MKTKLLSVRLLSLFAATAVLVPTVSWARNDDVSPSALRTVTKDEYKEHGWDKLRGAAVRAADGKHLGDIRDLVLDSRSGDIRFAIVSGGGFVGIGGDRRLLPFSALIRDPKEHGFITRLQQVDWDLLPALDKDDLKEDRIALTSEQRRNLEHLGNRDWARAFAPLADSDASDRRYVLASSLVGKPLYGENEKVGKVDDLYFGANGGPAMAVVDIDHDYVPADGREFLVPISALEATAGEHGRVHTNLSAAQFDEVAGITLDPADRDAGPWARYRKHDRHAADLRREDTVDPAGTPVMHRSTVGASAPTGLASGYHGDAAASAAQSIRDGWANDATLHAYNLRAEADGDRIVLSGTLPTPKLAERAEATARRVTTDITIDNRIRVDGDTR
jgi:sporulation protein YlmC with PRC-barrel domain